MSNSAGQPISPTLSPEVQEVVADWAKTLEAPGANPELLPTRGVGGDSRSRRKLERHLRARHAEEMGWFYGWKRFLVASHELGRLFVPDSRALRAIELAPEGLDEATFGSTEEKVSSLRLAESAFRWAPSACNRIQLAFHRRDRAGMGSEVDWEGAVVGLAHADARVDAWRSDAAKLCFDAGNYLEASQLYSQNFLRREIVVEGCSALVTAVLGGDPTAAGHVALGVEQSSARKSGIDDYARALTVAPEVLADLSQRFSECGDSHVASVVSDILLTCRRLGDEKGRH